MDGTSALNRNRRRSHEHATELGAVRGDPVGDLAGMEESMNEDEKYVRSKWKTLTVHFGPGNPHEKPSTWLCYVCADCETYEKMLSGCKAGEAWSAARAFTEDRLKEIVEVDEEIHWVSYARIVGSVIGFDMDAKRRTLSRLQAIRADLARGMVL